MCEEICSLLLSRPSRGAWIEIKRWAYYTHAHRSRPSRGAWIEILFFGMDRNGKFVAPLAGRVD